MNGNKKKNYKYAGVAESADAQDFNNKNNRRLITIKVLETDTFTVYKCNDNRFRVYNKNTKKVTSYPRMLMEEKLGRPLEPYEQVHHKDENPTNNNISNLSVEMLGHHQTIHNNRKYYGRLTVCAYCGKIFHSNAKQQRNFYINRRRSDRNCTFDTPFCSKQCVGLYGKEEQMRRNMHTECE